MGMNPLHCMHSAPHPNDEKCKLAACLGCCCRWDWSCCSNWGWHSHCCWHFRLGSCSHWSWGLDLDAETVLDWSNHHTPGHIMCQRPTPPVPQTTTRLLLPSCSIPTHMIQHGQTLPQTCGYTPPQAAAPVPPSTHNTYGNLPQTVYAVAGSQYQIM